MPTKEEAEKFLSNLSACGWFEGVPAQVASKLRQKILAAEEETLWPAAMAVGLDLECIYQEGDYTKILKEFAANSGGLFAPKNISEKWSEKTAKIEFTHAGKRFSARLSLESDWADEKIFSTVQKALKARKAPVGFLELGDLAEGQELFFALTTPEAFKKAQQQKLIPSEAAQQEERKKAAAAYGRIFGKVDALTFRFGDELVVSSGNHHWIYNWHTGEALKQFHLQYCAYMGFTQALPDGRILITESRSTTLWNPDHSSTHPIIRYDGEQFVDGLEISRDGKVVVARGWLPAKPMQIQCWDVASSRRINAWEAGRGGLKSARFSPDGKRIASGSQVDLVTIWSLDGANLREWNAGGSPDVAWHPSQEVVASVGSGNLPTGEAAFHDARTGEIIARTKIESKAQKCAFVANGTLLLAWGGYEYAASAIEFPSGKCIRSARMHRKSGVINALAAHPDLPISAAAVGEYDSPAIVIYDWVEGKVIRTIKGGAAGLAERG